MSIYKKIFKLNLFNQIYSPIMLFFYIIIFVKEAPSNTSIENIVNAQIFSAIFLFLPILILVIINLFFIFRLKVKSNLLKIILLMLTPIPLLSGLSMLILNNVLIKYLDNEKYLNFDYLNCIQRNILISSIYFVSMIMILIIYSILDSNFRSKYNALADIFAILFVVSIFAFIYDYFVLLFFNINAKDITIKQKLFLLLPIYNMFIFKKISIFKKHKNY